MTSSARGHWRALLPRLLTILVLGLFLFAFGVYLSRQLDARISAYVNNMLRRLKYHYGLQISVGSMEVGFGRMVLSEISVGDSHWLVIDRAEVAISFLPWRDFLRPSAVGMDHAIVKLPWSRSLWPEDFKNFLQKIERPPLDHAESGSSGSSSMVPELVQINAAQVQVYDGDAQKLLVDHLYLSGRWRDRKMNMRLRRVAVLDDIDGEFIEVDLGTLDPRRWQVAVKHRQGFQGFPDWTCNCVVDRADHQASCDVNATVLPEFLVKRGQRAFGAAFAPGYQGRLVLKSSPTGDQRWSEGPLDVEVDGRLTNVSGEHAVIGTGIVGPVNLRIQTKTQVSVSRRSLITNKARVALLTKADVPQEGIALWIDADLAWPHDSKKPQGQLTFDLSDVSCKQALAALPENFVPELALFKLGGTAELHGVMRLDGSHAEVQIKNSRFDCVVTETPEIYTATYLNAPFMIERDAGDGKILIPVDPARPDFTSYHKIPVLVRSAFVSSEDTGFFQHKGVEIGAIVGAAERNAVAGRAAVGGSTITMQTVKNLFLARDKTISRKAQEMFLAWHLEREITKERILEIYLNMVEFGPGLYGIGRASQRFFNKDPSHLSLKEAVYLASLLPAPIPRYAYFCKGELTPNYERIVKQLLDRMLSLGRISAEEYQTASDERLVFSQVDRDGTCNGIGVKNVDEKKPMRFDDGDLNQE
jgi:hypothetical protein